MHNQLQQTRLLLNAYKGKRCAWLYEQSMCVNLAFSTSSAVSSDHKGVIYQRLYMHSLSVLAIVPCCPLKDASDVPVPFSDSQFVGMADLAPCRIISILLTDLSVLSDIYCYHLTVFCDLHFLVNLDLFGHCVVEPLTANARNSCQA